MLAKYIASIQRTDENVIAQDLLSNRHKLRRAVLSNLHIVTQYFNARSINYDNLVLRELFQADDYWMRYEFAKARGQIHSHGIIFSSSHASQIEQALDMGGETTVEEKAERLFKWLQTDECDNDDDGLFSPHVTSMHPGGGEQVVNDKGEKSWIPNKEYWPAPEGQ